MVFSLIDYDTKWWKVDVIRATFLPHGASTILKIPLSYNLPKDCLNATKEERLQLRVHITLPQVLWIQLRKVKAPQAPQGPYCGSRYGSRNFLRNSKFLLGGFVSMVFQLCKIYTIEEFIA